MGKGGNFTKTISHFANEDVPNHSEIEVLESKFNINHKVIGIGTNIFRFNPVGVAETTLYTSTGFSSAFYSTKSKTELGGIHSIEILNKGFEVSSLPILTSIGTTTGSNAVLTIETDEIGEIEGTQTIIQGIEFPPSKDLQPEAESNLILDLKNVFTLKSNFSATFINIFISDCTYEWQVMCITPFKISVKASNSISFLGITALIFSLFDNEL